jgi:ribosomal protein L40E
VLFVDGKTGQRRVRVIFSSPAIAEWLNHHQAQDAKAPLWTSLDGASSAKPLEYYAFRKVLRDAAVRAGIRKRVNPHSFRHARASNLAADLTEAQMKELFGWTQDSKMASVYVHLSGRNIDNALLRLSGVKTEEEVKEEEHSLRVRVCLRCKENNAPTSRFCTRCGSPLDVKTAMELRVEEQRTDELMDKLLDDTEVKQLLLRKLRALSSTEQIQVVTNP